MLAPAAALAEAQRLLDAGYPFHAHEVLEGVWKDTTGDDRAVWKGLAQLAVGLTHLQRGNATGAVALLRRGAEAVAAVAPATPYGIDVARLAADATALADRVEQGGIPADPVQLHLR